MSLSGTDGCQHAGPTNRIPESQPSGQQTQTDSRSRHTIKRSFRPSDQVSSTPYLPSPVSPFHGEPLFSRSASVWPLGQGASSCGQKKFPAMFESTSTVPLELSLILLTQCIGDAALARASTSASRPFGFAAFRNIERDRQAMTSSSSSRLIWLCATMAVLPGCAEASAGRSARGCHDPGQQARRPRGH